MTTLLKSYTSTNGICMIEGYFYNWEGQNKYGREPDKEFPLETLNMNLSGKEWKRYYINYYMKDQILSIHGTKFKVNDLEDAENLVSKFIEGNNLEVPPLYDKAYQTEFSNLIVINT